MDNLGFRTVRPIAPAAEKKAEAPAAMSRIAVALEPPVAHITLQHAPLNVIDIPMMDELATALDEIEERADIAVVLLSATGKAFSVGVDVAAHTPDKVQEMLSKFHGVILKLVGTKKVTVAVVRGHCLGGGAELAMVCDLVYTSETATWAFPEIKLGCYPPVAATALAALVGQKHAADLVLTGRSIPGSEAAAMGLANRAVADEQLDAAVEESLKSLSELSPAALGVTKKAIYAWSSMHFDKGLARAEQIYLDELMKTEDAQEGIRAFVEKRKPVWKGR
ncbi:MAG TPA: enoyl-CoA hydratase/isomerase family protein [Terriglobales bacterium]|nr:enoyl-CoA hydratase/isomerase family protein [Terriglobales bacterium]